MSYQLSYELSEALQNEPEALQEVDIYNFNNLLLYAAIMSRLAQDLPTGEQSPFSNQSPGSAHGVLVSNLIFLLSLQANEFALIPDVMLLKWMRVWGATRRLAEYPLINLRFNLAQSALANGIRAVIVSGTEIISRNDPSLIAITIDDATIEGGNEFAIVPARLNRLGAVGTIQVGEFSVMPQLLSSIESVASEGLISEGRPVEAISLAVLRMRDALRRGERAVTDRDYQRIALEAGAVKANFIRGRIPGVDGFFRDLRTVAVLPAQMVPLVKAALKDQRMADERLSVIPAEIIPIDGLIQIRVITGVADFEAFNLAARAIADNINPPKGKWGDVEIEKSIATVLEKIAGIYAVPVIVLKRADTSELINQLKVEPWQLFDVQQSIVIEVLR